MTFFSLVWKNLLQRPTRSLLTVAGIAIGIGVVVALASLAWGFERAWAGVYTARGTDLVVSKGGSLNPIAPAFDEGQIRALRTLSEIEGASSLLTDAMPVESTPVVLVFGLESKTYVWDHLRLVSGRWPTDDAEPVVLLGTMAAEVLRKTVGSPIQVGTTGLTVCGIFDSNALAENGALVMTLPQLQRATGQAGKINFLNLKLTPGTGADQIDVLRRSIMARLPGFNVFAASEVAEHNSAIQAAKAMSWATSAIALVVGAVGVMNTMLMSVFERTREIGILLSIGWRRRRILRMILYESISLSVTGGLVGTLAGAATVILLQTVPPLRGRIEGAFSMQLFGLAFAVSIGLGVLGGVYPAYRGSRMRPIEALGHE